MAPSGLTLRSNTLRKPRRNRRPEMVAALVALKFASVLALRSLIGFPRCARADAGAVHAHGNVTEDECQIILFSRATVAMNAEDDFLIHSFITPAPVRSAFALRGDTPNC